MTLIALRHGRAASHELLGVTYFEWFWGMTVEPVASECWEWQGELHGLGYGRVYWPETQRTVMTHRAAWCLSRGKAMRSIPRGWSVLHHCDNRRCVRPTHLYLGTQAENCEDRDRYRGKSVAARRRIRTRQHRARGIAV